MNAFLVSCPCPCGVRFPVDRDTMRVVGDLDIWPHCEQIPSCRCINCLRAKRIVPADYEPPLKQEPA